MLDYNRAINAVVEAIHRHNTTTASPDLSYGLSSRVETVEANDPGAFYGRSDRLPAVIVNLESKSQSIEQIGVFPTTGTQIRRATVNYEVWGVFQRAAVSTRKEEALADKWRFADNIEAVLAKNFQFSGTALQITAIDADFTPRAENDLTEVFRLRVQVEYMYR